MKRAALFFALIVPGFVPAAYPFTMIGSRTMYALNMALTTKYRAVKPDVTIEVSDAGTGKGIESVIAGSADMAAVSRPLRPRELQEMRKHAQSDGYFAPVAREGISIYLHPRNSVNSLTIEQIGGIYSGRITNWKDVGGADLPIHLYAFDKSTGRYWYLFEEVMKNENLAGTVRYTDEVPVHGISDAANLAAKEDQMLKWVSSDTAGIGFGDLKKIRMVKLAKVQTGTAAYWPTPGDVASGAYPLARTLGYLFRHKPSGGLQQYIEWVASQDETIRAFGFVPVE